MPILLLATVTALQGAPPPICFDGVLGASARARRAIVEVGHGASAHLYMRPPRVVKLAPAALPAGELRGEDGATVARRAGDSVVVLSRATASDTQRTTLHRTAVDPRAAALAGEWTAPVGPGGVVRLIARLSIGPCGVVAGVFDSPDQGQRDLPITAARIAGDSITLEAEYLGLRITMPVEGGEERGGRMSQHGVVSEIVLRRGSTFARPQEPRRPFPYAEHQVRFSSRASGVELQGMLTIPAGPGPHPAVVLISGSGAQDRDETIAGHRPFLLLSDHLTRRGYAVLRADDRGVPGTGGDPLRTRLHDVANDVEGAVAFLRTREEIDRSRIGLLGHSEGGYVAPIVGARDSAIAFLVLLAAPTVRGREVLAAQRSAMARASGEPDGAVRVDSLLLDRIFAVLDRPPADSHLGAAVDSALSEWMNTLPAGDRAIARASLAARSAAQDSASLRLWTSPWFRSFYHHDPHPLLRRLRVPVLALFGEIDRQVPLAQSAPAIEEAFGGARQPLLTVVHFPGTNHLMQRARTGLMDEYIAIEETISPLVLETLASWLATVASTPRPSTPGVR